MVPGAASGEIALARGTLWRAVREKTRHALATGALERIPTECETVEHEGVRFLVRVLARLAREERPAEERDPRPVNPFLPYDEDLFVADVSPTHVVLLNKYNAVDHHVLVVTRAFEEQESLLTLRDFEALRACMAEFDALGFYNAGRVAGASQRHKHLQLVPVPLGEGPTRLPIDPLLAAAHLETDSGTAPGLPFRHALACVEGWIGLPPREAADRAHRHYRELLRGAGVEGARRPYNLLVTREWMLVVPRVRESWRSVPVNALGFAGSLFARDARELDRVKELGPMTFLRHTAAPLQPS